MDTRTPRPFFFFSSLPRETGETTSGEAEFLNELCEFRNSGEGSEHSCNFPSPSFLFSSLARVAGKGYEKSNKYKKLLGIDGCSYDTDYWAGAVKKCHDIGLHLPSLQTLAVIAGSKYGRTDIEAYTSILVNSYTASNYPTSTGNCEDYFKANGSYRLTEGTVICVDESSIPTDSSSSVSSLTGAFWSSSEYSASYSVRRNIVSAHSVWGRDARSTSHVPLCVGD